MLWSAAKSKACVGIQCRQAALARVLMASWRIPRLRVRPRMILGKIQIGSRLTQKRSPTSTRLHLQIAILS